MKNKIIVLDVDGTLLPSNNIPDTETIEYLQELEKNNIIVLASSRGYHDLSIIHDKYGLKGPIISNNGGALDFFDGSPGVCMSISISKLKAIFTSTKDIIVSAFYSFKQKLFIYNKLDILSFLYKINENSILIEGSFDEIELESPNSIYFILKNSEKEKFFNEVKKYDDEINLFEYGHDRDYSITILTLKNTNKAYAILELLMKLKRNEQDLIVFGDGDVDIPMLCLNGITVAMINSLPEVKNKAKYVTDFDNNNKGVLKFLQKIDQNIDQF